MLAKIKKVRNSSFSKPNLVLVLLFSALSLVLIGLVVLASASLGFSSGNSSLFGKQLVSFFIAIVSFIVVWRINLDHLREYRFFIAGIILLLLILVLVPGIGIKVNGSQRWLGFGGFRFQVSDLAKLGLIFLLADYIARNYNEIDQFKKGFIIPGALVGGTCLLVLFEPDFGTAFLCGCVGLIMMYLAGTRLLYLLPSLGFGLLLLGVGVMLSPVRLKRLMAFMDMEANKLDGAYQLWQAILAFTAGGIEGVGLGNGRQQMAFLPEAHTDFIFPVIAEELGVFFSLGVVFLYFILFLSGLAVMRRTSDFFSRFLALGAVMCIVLQALINLCVVTGLAPTKGISLPFISYGGSNLILMFIFVGILMNCLRRWSDNPFEREREI